MTEQQRSTPDPRTSPPDRARPRTWDPLWPTIVAVRYDGAAWEPQVWSADASECPARRAA